ncbi:MAG: hypothetical protein CM15mP47_4000 [Methanobacteriota archaeon]|nr:MAG: hypothetical protein CM15mP47_4000 [Euryarchaeota archaeon]
MGNITLCLCIFSLGSTSSNGPQEFSNRTFDASSSLIVVWKRRPKQRFQPKDRYRSLPCVLPSITVFVHAQQHCKNPISKNNCSLSNICSPLRATAVSKISFEGLQDVYTSLPLQLLQPYPFVRAIMWAWFQLQFQKLVLLPKWDLLLKSLNLLWIFPPN